MRVASSLALHLRARLLEVRKRWLMWRFPELREWDFEDIERP